MASVLGQGHYKHFEDRFQVKTDMKRLQQVLLNLLSNAIKFTDRDGKIQVIVEKLKDNFIRLSVVDNGKGIKVKNQDKLFKLFGTFKDQKRKINTNGIGLGLVISKLIVNKFNGYIDFVSKHKKGSTFFYTFETIHHDQEQANVVANVPKTRMTIDLSQMRIMGVQKKETEAQKIGNLNEVLDCYNMYAKFAKSRILVVDDEEFCISSMKAILFSCGIDPNYQVDFCIQGKEALDQVKKSYENGMQYSLILTDFSMPVMNGMESATKIRSYLKGKKAKQHPAIIGVTGHVTADFEQEGLKAGMDKIYDKPLYKDKMKEILNTYYVPS